MTKDRKTHLFPILNEEIWTLSERVVHAGINSFKYRHFKALCLEKCIFISQFFLNISFQSKGNIYI